VRNDRSSQAVGLVLSRLPRHRLRLERRQVTRDPAGAHFERLAQRGAAGFGVTLAATRTLWRPSGNADRGPSRMRLMVSRTTLTG
jgi:hypothetical protein